MFNASTIKLIMDSTTIENLILNNTVLILDLYVLCPLIDANNLESAKYLDFSICKRNNFTCKYLTSSPIHIMPLG